MHKYQPLHSSSDLNLSQSLDETGIHKDKKAGNKDFAVEHSRSCEIPREWLENGESKSSSTRNFAAERNMDSSSANNDHVVYCNIGKLIEIDDSCPDTQATLTEIYETLRERIRDENLDVPISWERKESASGFFRVRIISHRKVTKTFQLDSIIKPFNSAPSQFSAEDLECYLGNLGIDQTALRSAGLIKTLEFYKKHAGTAVGKVLLSTLERQLSPEVHGTPVDRLGKYSAKAHVTRSNHPGGHPLIADRHIACQKKRDYLEPGVRAGILRELTDLSLSPSKNDASRIYAIVWEHAQWSNSGIELTDLRQFVHNAVLQFKDDMYADAFVTIRRHGTEGSQLLKALYTLVKEYQNNTDAPVSDKRVIADAMISSDRIRNKLQSLCGDKWQLALLQKSYAGAFDKINKEQTAEDLITWICEGDQTSIDKRLLIYKSPSSILDDEDHNDY